MHPLEFLLSEFRLSLSQFNFLSALMSGVNSDSLSAGDMRELLDRLMIEQRERGYVLTRYGVALVEVIDSLKQ